MWAPLCTWTGKNGSCLTGALMGLLESTPAGSRVQCRPQRPVFKCFAAWKTVPLCAHPSCVQPGRCKLPEATIIV
eukprot:162369-Pelagomonas_calceolata.AAC.8